MGISSDELKLGLRSHAINYGKKYTGCRNYISEHKYGTHMKMVEPADMVTELLLETLKEEGFTLCYGEKFRSAPVMDQNKYSTTKERIRQFQSQNK